jgi:NAD(P)-dependent dehydrogenase (short-subunit alcohol dehydrogenase family)
MAKRAIFITGTSSGIGLASVIRLHNLDFRIFAGVFPGEDTAPLDSLNDVKIIPIDVTDSDMIASAAQIIERETNGAGLYGLFNNAGIPVTGPMEFTPMAALRKQMEVNLFGHIEVTQRMLPYLRQASPARIVNTTSLLGRIVVPFCGPYSISKYGMEVR